MKILLTIFLLLIISFTGMAQCDVQKLNRADGVTVRYMKPNRVGISDKMMLSLSVQTNGAQFFVVALSIFQTKAVNMKGTMTIQFENEKSITIPHFASQSTTFGKFPATNSIYTLGENDLPVIAETDIKSVTLQMEDGEMVTIVPKANADILKVQYTCLK